MLPRLSVPSPKLRALERAGILTWANRIKRVREYVPAIGAPVTAEKQGTRLPVRSLSRRAGAAP